MLIQNIIPIKKNVRQNLPARKSRRTSKKVRNKLVSVLLIALLIIQMFLPVRMFFDPLKIEIQKAKAATLTVCASGCGYTTIQAAINAAVEYDTIEVGAGTYTENVVINTQHLTLIGAGMHVVTVVASNSSLPAIRINADYTSVSGFSARNATGIADEGTFFINTADHCVISHNMVDGSFGDPIGFYAYSLDHLIMESNIVKNGHYGFYFDGLYDGTTPSVIKKNQSIGNTYGFVFPSGNVIRDFDFTCNIAKNNSENGIRFSTVPADYIIQNNSIIENGVHQGGGIYHYQFYGIADNISATNNWWGTTDDAVIAASISGSVTYLPKLSAQNSCTESHLYTDATSWWYEGEAHITSSTPIQDAINNAIPESTVHIGAGNYTDNIVTRTDHVTIEGAGSGSVTVTAATADLPVFQILHDNVSLSGVTASGATSIPWNHGTIYVENASYVTVNDVVANDGYTGIRCESVSNITITDNTANNNGTVESGGAGIIINGTDIACNNNTTNRNLGNGIHCEGNGDMNNNVALLNTHGISTNGDINVYDNTAGLNSETGIDISSASNIMVTGNCVFQNTALGMGVYGSSNITVHDNYFNNTNNNDGSADWYVTKAAGPNVVGGAFIGGNYWSDYTGTDTDSDGLGDTDLPHHEDMYPLMMDDHTVANLTAKTKFANIQDAINAGSNEDKIAVSAGVYTENVDLGWANAYTLIGSHKDDVTVNSLIISSRSTVSGFTMVNDIATNDSTATNINIIGNKTGSGSTSAFGGLSNSIVKDNVFGKLIMYSTATNAIFEDNIFDATGGFGLYICGPNVTNAEFSSMSFLGLPGATDGAIYISAGSSNTFTNTTFEYSERAIKIESGAPTTFIQENNKVFVSTGGTNTVTVDADKSTLLANGTYDYRDFTITTNAEITVPETSLWETTGDQNKQWKIEATGGRTITFQLGDMRADTKYDLKVDSVKISDATSNSLGVITFPAYSGSFSEKTFTVEIYSNTAPTATFNSAIQKTDGTGKIDISIEVDDADDNTCKAKIEYKLGADCSSGTSDPTLDESAGATADNTPVPDLENDNVYQAGTVTPILTSSGSNTVTFDWDGKADIPDANGTYCLKLTVNDGTEDQATPATTTLTLDNVAPTNVGISSITADSSAQLTITAQTATDATSGLHSTPYWFNETTGNTGATDSTAWQTLTSFVDSDLSVNTQYTYQTKVKDAAGNESSYSTISSKYTLSNIPSSLSLTADSPIQITASWNANSNPANTEYYIENTTAGTNSGWTTSTSWISSDLTCGTSYSFKVKSRNGEDVNSSYTGSVSIETGSCASGMPSSAYNSPSSPEPTPENPENNFSLAINNGSEYTNDQIVTLKLISGPDTVKMAISNTPDFKYASQIDYQEEIIWDLCEKNGDNPACVPGSEFQISGSQFTVYAKFYTQYGVSSETVSVSINYISDLNENNLITGPDGIKVYTINKNNYRRHIFNPTVFGMYLHLKWENIKKVSQTILDSFKTSNLYRTTGKNQVYFLEEIDEIKGKAIKHYLDITPEDFSQKGYDWNEVFIANKKEDGYYEKGEEIQ